MSRRNFYLCPAHSVIYNSSCTTGVAFIARVQLEHSMQLIRVRQQVTRRETLERNETRLFQEIRSDIRERIEHGLTRRGTKLLRYRRLVNGEPNRVTLIDRVQLGSRDSSSRTPTDPTRCRLQYASDNRETSRKIAETQISLRGGSFTPSPSPVSARERCKKSERETKIRR